jgi:protein-tyrosine phosphatase
MDFSEITDGLLIGTTPRKRDYDLLRSLGVRLTINMRFSRATYPEPIEPAIHYLWLRTFDNPLIPIPVRALIRGTHSALETLNNGGRVYVHCAYGRHRSVAMGSAILIAQGLSPETAMSLIKEKRAMADPDVFYIRRRILLFARQWAMNYQ